MGRYIGARYVTKVYENSLDPSSAEWEGGVTYEPLTMVTYNNGSYLSKKEVPGNIGNPAANPSYWTQTGFYNGQIANLQDQINDINAIIGNMQLLETDDTSTIVNAINSAYNNFKANVKVFGAKGDGITDDTLALQNTINYAEDHHIDVYIPAGRYLITDSLKINSRVKVYGEGVMPPEWENTSNISTLVYNGVGACILIMGDNEDLWDDDASASYAISVVIKNIRIVNNGEGSDIKDCGIAIHGHDVSIIDCNIRGFNVGLFIKNSYLITLSNIITSCVISTYIHKPATVYDIHGGQYYGMATIRTIPDELWELIPNHETFSNNSTGFMIDGAVDIKLDNLAIETVDYAVQMSHTSWVIGDKINVENCAMGGFKICEPLEDLTGVTANHAYVDITTAHFYNGTYATGFAWFIMPAKAFAEVHCRLRGSVEKLVNSSVGSYYGRCGILDVRQTSEILGVPASNPNAIFLSHPNIAHSGQIRSGCKFEEDRFVVDITMENVAITDTSLTSAVTFDIPAIRSLVSGTWSYDTDRKIFGYGFDKTNNKKYILSISGQYNTLEGYPEETPVHVQTITYDKLADFSIIKLFGSYKLFK